MLFGWAHEGLKGEERLALKYGKGTIAYKTAVEQYRWNHTLGLMDKAIRWGTYLGQQTPEEESRQKCLSFPAKSWKARQPKPKKIRRGLFGNY